MLSTFNGSAHLDELLESLIAQSAQDWRLYVRDDGSVDDTMSRLATYAATDPRIEILPQDGRNLRAPASFGVLLEHALARGERYVFLCDQDDVWLPDKTERMLAILRERETMLGADVPLLLHTDLRVVDDRLGVVHHSFVALQHLDADGGGEATRLLLRNTITGCATAVNAALLSRALPFPDIAMHDWWLGQCAAAFGEVLFLDRPTVLYRQHASNVVGARGMLRRAIGTLRSPVTWWQESAKRFLFGLRQLWTIRARAHERGLPLSVQVSRSLELLWDSLGRDRTAVGERVTAARRSGVLPRSRSMRLLLLIRIATLPSLRRRFGDERSGLR